MNVKIVNNAEEATGLAIIIDVFRAFTVEPYLINNGVERIIPVGDKEIAYKLKEENSEYILVGERKGVKLPGFDFGNSPSQIKDVDFTGKTVVHTTSCGTQGIVRAVNADEIITGSLVNVSAIIKYIKNNNISDVSIVSMSRPGEKPTAEDDLCARVLKCLLEGNEFQNIDEEIESLMLTNGKKFFDEELKDVFPREDYFLCTDVDRFNFVLKVHKDDNGLFYVEKIDV